MTISLPSSTLSLTLLSYSPVFSLCQLQRGVFICVIESVQIRTTRMSSVMFGENCFSRSPRIERPRIRQSKHESRIAFVWKSPHLLLKLAMSLWFKVEFFFSKYNKSNKTWIGTWCLLHLLALFTNTQPMRFVPVRTMQMSFFFGFGEQ